MRSTLPSSVRCLPCPATPGGSDTGPLGFLCLCSLIHRNSNLSFYTSSNGSWSPQSMSHWSNKIFTTWTFGPLWWVRHFSPTFISSCCWSSQCPLGWRPLLQVPLVVGATKPSPSHCSPFKAVFHGHHHHHHHHPDFLLYSRLHTRSSGIRPALSIILTSDFRRIVSPGPSFLQSEVFLQENLGVSHEENTGGTEDPARCPAMLPSWAEPNLTSCSNVQLLKSFNKRGYSQEEGRVVLRLGEEWWFALAAKHWH